MAIKGSRARTTWPLDEREEYQARFRQEAQAAGGLDHPDIVKIYDVESAYLVMEYVEGRRWQALRSRTRS